MQLTGTSLLKDCNDVKLLFQIGSINFNFFLITTYLVPCSKFQEILNAHNISEKPTPEYKDTFLVTRQIFDVYNYNTEIKIPS